MINNRKLAIDLAAFKQYFIPNIVSPFELKLQTIKSPMIHDFLISLREEGPALMYGWITSEENYGKKSGIQKYWGVLERVKNWLEQNNYGKLGPLVFPIVESCTQYIFKNSIGGIFKEIGISNEIRGWLSFDTGNKTSIAQPIIIEEPVTSELDTEEPAVTPVVSPMSFKPLNSFAKESENE